MLQRIKYKNNGERNPRFSMCHTQHMSIYDFYTTKELLTLRSLMQNEDTDLLIRFLGDYVTDTATRSSLTAEEVRGMSILLHKVKTCFFDLENQLDDRKNEV